MHSTTAPISLNTPLRRVGKRLWGRLRNTLALWRAQRHANAVQRASARSLRGLPEHTLRDIGMQGRVPVLDQRQSLFDRHPGRW